jgi:hypothetical protein
MAMGKLREAMSDMAETIRRVFKAPQTTASPMGFATPSAPGSPSLEAMALAPSYDFEALLRIEPPLAGAKVAVEPLTWAATVRGEPGWASWSTDATVCQLPLFRAEKCQRLLVPALPRQAVPQRVPLAGFSTRSRSGREPFPPPAVGSIRPQWTPPKAFGALELALGLPVAVNPEDLGKLSKAIWMRYTLQLVRTTGQNIRNLEILGLYRIPCKGTRQVRHEPATGRLLVTLGPEALKARKAPFILARQKDDNAVVCCFVEEP